MPTTAASEPMLIVFAENVSDNMQVRTDMLDHLVWQEVCALLESPQRLEQEYERRLQSPSREDKGPAAI
jgi:hypothetical protein